MRGTLQVDPVTTGQSAQQLRNSGGGIDAIFLLVYVGDKLGMERAMALRVNLVGTGRVGQTLARRIVDAEGWEIQDVFVRDPARARAALDFIGAGRPVKDLAAMRPADLWLLTVPDDRIATVAAAIAAAGTAAAVAVHCSGCLPAAEMAALGAAGWQLASAHPILTFAEPALSVTRLAGTFFGIEGDAAACERATALVRVIGGRAFAIRSDSKAIYHGAAVFSNCFAVVLQAVARQSWARAGVPDDIAAELNAGLLRATVENLLAVGPQAALTGPAARGDHGVVERQRAAFAAWDAQAARVYAELSAMAGRLKATGSTRAEDAPDG